MTNHDFYLWLSLMRVKLWETYRNFYLSDHKIDAIKLCRIITKKWTLYFPLEFSPMRHFFSVMQYCNQRAFVMNLKKMNDNYVVVTCLEFEAIFDIVVIIHSVMIKTIFITSSLTVIRHWPYHYFNRMWKIRSHVLHPKSK